MLQLIVLIVVYVTCGSLRDTIDVWHCLLLYTLHKSPVLSFRTRNSYLEVIHRERGEEGGGEGGDEVAAHTQGHKVWLMVVQVEEKLHEGDGVLPQVRTLLLRLPLLQR